MGNESNVIAVGMCNTIIGENMINSDEIYDLIKNKI